MIPAFILDGMVCIVLFAFCQVFVFQDYYRRNGNAEMAALFSDGHRTAWPGLL